MIDDHSGARVFLGRLLTLAATLSGLALLALMLLVTISVVFRYVLNEPILGSQEITQIGMAVVVMLAMPFAAHTDQHIRVDVLDPFIGRSGRYIGDLASRFLSIVVLGFVVWKTWGKFLDAIEYDDVTNMLEIPLWIAYIAIVTGFSTYTLVLFVQLVDQLRGGLSQHE